MPDSRIYDAINLFKFSPTGLGTGTIGGDATYQAKYQRLTGDILRKLWSLWSTDEIGWTNLGTHTIGDSEPDRAGYDIRVSTVLEPPAAVNAYSTVQNQGKLAATSCNLVHEATHLVRDIDSYAEEELLCRTVQLFYFRDLTSTRSYRSQFTGTSCTARYLPTTPFYNDYQRRINRLLSHDLVDSVLAMATYRNGRGGTMSNGGLETDSTATFVSRSLSWWGGLSNRWASTCGYYLRSLASRTTQDYSYQILEILESLSRRALTDWLVAKSCAGDPTLIQRGLAVGSHYRDRVFASRISTVQRALHEDFAYHFPGR